MVSAQPLAFIDTETTGLSPARDRIIEIGIIRVENGKIVDQIDTLINPNSFVPPEIFTLTGISESEIVSAPEFGDVENKIQAILEGAIFTAHNARFDYAFLKHELVRLGKPYQARVLCTVKLVRHLFPGLRRYSLSHLIDHFGINPAARHRAYADATVLWELYRIAVQEHGAERVHSEIDGIIKTSALPSNLRRIEVENLPESPGIYMFYGDDSKLPLYVGKSVNVKSRVKNHFTNDHQVTKDLTMSSQISRVEAVVTAGEVGALIREVDAIKNLSPVYNKKLRKLSELYVATSKTVNGYLSVKIDRVAEEKLEPSGVVAIYKTKKTAQAALHDLCRKHNLCPKLMGLEHGPGRCFMSQIGSCFGACTAEEDSAIYNLRFREAFDATTIEPWPFSGPVSLKEQNLEGLVEIHVISDWKYLGSVVYAQDEIDQSKKQHIEPVFDWDIYRILAKATRNRKKVHVLSPEELSDFLS